MQKINRIWLKKIVQSMIEHDQDEWPPCSSGAFYQVIRPTKKIPRDNTNCKYTVEKEI